MRVTTASVILTSLPGERSETDPKYVHIDATSAEVEKHNVTIPAVRLHVSEARHLARFILANTSDDKE